MGDAVIRAIEIIAFAALCVSCTPPTVAEDVAPRDATRDGPRAMCVTDRDCDDAVFCNGAERCMPGATGADMFGCVPPADTTPCLDTQTCSEATQRCRSDCARAPDADGDGHRAAECGGDDCDDADAHRFPGNAEVCDGSHDEDCVLVTVGARDMDRDGADSSACCNIVAGSAVSCGGDCDDTRADVGPASAEVCDGADNNCNGAIDEGTTQQAFRPDCDGDGFGDANATPVMACTQPTTQPPCPRMTVASTWSTRASDCRDDDDTIHVGVPELCDGVDNNCDGTTDENPAATNSCGSVPVGVPACSMGRCSVGCTNPAADCDGVFDNGCEVDISSSNANCGGCGHRCESGQQCVSSVCVQLVCPAGTHDCSGRCVSNSSIDSCGSRCTPCPQPPNSTATCEGISFETCVVNCNDNYIAVHDECAPAAVIRSPRHGAVVGTLRPTFSFTCGECSGGTVQVSTTPTFGSPIEFTGIPPFIAADRDLAAGNYFWRARYTSPVPATAPPLPVASLFVRNGPAGASPAIHAVYDFNGDARVDTAIGAPASSTTGAGSVFVFEGTGTGFMATPIEVVAPGGEDTFGVTVAIAGDVNGDGKSDLVVGAPGYASGTGRVYVFVSGSGTGIGSPVVLEALETMHHYGNAITGGDFDGDGFADVAAAEGDAMNVYFGRPSGIRTVPDVRFTISTDTAGGDVTSLASGDINADGRDDYIVGAGAPDTVHFPSQQASVIVHYGIDPTVGEGPGPTTYTIAGRTLGVHVAFAGDLNGDGFGDLATSSSAGTDHRAVVFLGASSSATPVAVEVLPAPFSTEFGTTLAWGGDIDGNGYDDLIVGGGGPPALGWLPGSATFGMASTVGTEATFPVAADMGLGWTIAGVGDVDGDHVADVIVGAGMAGSGSAQFVSGGAAGFRVSATLSPGRPVTHFGTSIAE